MLCLVWEWKWTYYSKITTNELYLNHIELNVEEKTDKDLESNSIKKINGKN